MPCNSPMLTDGQWAKIEPLLPQLRSGKGGGRPWADSRACWRGFYGSPATGRDGRICLEHIPPPSTCWRRLRDWEEREVWLRIWRTFLGELNRKGRLDWSEAFIDGSFASAKKGALQSERPSGARVQSGWWWSMARVFLVGKHLESASPAEVTLAETTLASIRVPNRHGRGRPQQKPQRLIATRPTTATRSRMRLKKLGIQLIAPHKANRVRKPTQDGRSLRRYRKRWKIERTNAWLGNFRRLVVRYERLLPIYTAFFHIACFMIVLNRL